MPLSLLRISDRVRAILVFEIGMVGLAARSFVFSLIWARCFEFSNPFSLEFEFRISNKYGSVTATMTQRDNYVPEGGRFKSS
jgi:hypothetical protein